MQSAIPKALQPLAGRPMADYVLVELARIGFSAERGNPPIVVLGYRAGEVRQVLGAGPRYVCQDSLLGTGDAARVAIQHVPPEATRLLLVHGDEPLIDGETYRHMLQVARQTGAKIVLLTGQVGDTQGLGRVVRDQTGKVCALRQATEIDPEQSSIREINFGAYVFDRSFLAGALDRLSPHESGEYYLTDVVEIAYGEGKPVAWVNLPMAEERMGVNDRRHLERAEQYIQSLEVVERRTGRAG